MISVSTSTLGDIGKVCMCKRILKEQTSLVGDIPFYKISTFGEKADCYIPREIYEDYKTRFSFPKKGDILISAAGTLGRIVVYDGEDAFFQDSNIVWIDNDETKVLNEYLYYFYKTNPWVKTFGSTIPRLYNDNIRSVSITYPTDISIQRDVVRVMSTVDSKIANNISICSDLENMAKLLYDYWFVQFDFPDENGRPYKSSGGKMVWNEELKREIPEGWAATKLEEHIGLERGISYSTSDLQGEGIPMINLGSFAIGGGYKEENLKTYSGAYSDDKIITPYDLIICLTQQTSIDPNKDVIGCSMLVPDIFDIDIVISQDLTKVVCSEELKYYLAQYFNTSYFHRYITGFASGSNILHLDVNGILNNTAVIPPKNVLIKFEKIMKTMFEKRSECLIENQQLASLRDFLLPMLMNGQVKVGKAGD